MDGIFPPDPSPNAPQPRFSRAFLHQQIEMVVGITRDRILPEMEPDTDIATVGFLIDADGMLAGTVMLVAAQPEISPHDMQEGFRRFLHDQHAAGYLVQFMGWLAEDRGTPQEIEDRLVNGTFVPPSERPDRIEVLTITAGSGEASACRVYDIVRDESRRIVRLEERPEIRDKAAPGSLFADLLRRE
jgi:hypothetical protein